MLEDSGERFSQSEMNLQQVIQDHKQNQTETKYGSMMITPTQKQTKRPVKGAKERKPIPEFSEANQG